MIYRTIGMMHWGSQKVLMYQLSDIEINFRVRLKKAVVSEEWIWACLISSCLWKKEFFLCIRDMIWTERKTCSDWKGKEHKTAKVFALWSENNWQSEIESDFVVYDDQTHLLNSWDGSSRDEA